MINFFESDIDITTNSNRTKKLSRLFKLLSVGSGALAVSGISIKAVSVLQKYTKVCESLKLHDALFTQIFKSKYLKSTVTNKNTILDMPFSIGINGRIPQTSLARFSSYTDATLIYSNSIKAFKDGDPVRAVNILQRNISNDVYSTSDTIVKNTSYKYMDYVNIKNPLPDTPEQVSLKFSAIDEFFANLGLKITKIPIIGSIVKALTSRFGNVTATVILAILVIIFIIGMYYLVKFLLKKWKKYYDEKINHSI